MKQVFFKQLILSVFFLLCMQSVFAEGTAQLTPTLASDNTALLQLWANNDATRNSFTYGCPGTKRLNFTIGNPETIYFGITAETADLTGTSTLWYRIISPSSTVVFPADGTWQQVTNTGAGSIASWAEAIAGPANIVNGSGGYTPLSFAAQEAGDFYIEFYRNSTASKPTNTPVGGTSISIAAQEQINTRLRFFDLTIADAPNGNRINGRLFSQTWDIHTAGNPFASNMYVYTEDGTTQKINFNGMRAADMIISCNATGVSNSGDVFADAKSVTGLAGYGQYNVFLSTPDAGVYPSGIFGQILNTNNITITGTNPTELCINITVDKQGKGTILLNLNGQLGYQENSADVLLAADFAVGANCIPWNSKDGLGNIVAAGTTIDIQTLYYNGICHLLLYNVANNPYGLIVSGVPSATNNLLYWNDKALTSGTANLAGCAPASATSGCHAWGSEANGNVPGGNAPADWGTGKTINTYWYANLISVSSVYNMPGNFIRLTLPSGTTSVDLYAAPFQLTGGTPAGGTYSGDGVTDNVFSALQAGPGEHEITYTYTFSSAPVASLANARTATTDYTYTSTQKITVTSPVTTAVRSSAGITAGIYPNPNNGSFHIAGSAGSQLIIYDTKGTLIQSTAVTDADQFIQADLKQGMYHYILRGTAANANSGSFIVQ